jgi:hypothetical protein
MDLSSRTTLSDETRKVALSRSPTFPCCPWCATPLPVSHWHKVRAGPPLAYVAILSCPGCHAVLEGIGHTGHPAGIALP